MLQELDKAVTIKLNLCFIWIDKPIEKHKEKLFDLVAEYWGDQVLVKTFGSKNI